MWNEKHLDASQSSVLTPTGYKLHFVTTRSTASIATTAKVAKEVGSPMFTFTKCFLCQTMLTTMNSIEVMPSNPMSMLISHGDTTQLVKMPEGLPELVNYLDGPAAPSISAPATIAESATHERDFVDEHHRMLLFAGVTTLLLLIFRVHN